MHTQNKSLVLDPKKVFLIYLAIISLAGGVLIYLVASKVGPGISNDAVMMLSVAGNLAKSHEMIDFRGEILTQFPPLYPWLLSEVGQIFNLDIVIAGWILNIFVFSAIIWFSGLLFWNSFSEYPILAYFCSFVVFTSTSLIKISANIASDPLFMLIVIFFLMNLCSYMKSGSIIYLTFAAILAVVGCSQRYAGLSLVPVGGLVAGYKNKDHIRSAILAGLIFVIPTALPAFLWGFLHNFPINGSVFGTRIPFMPMLNFITGSEKLLNWFIPIQIISRVNPIFLYSAILGLLIFGIIRTGAGIFLSGINLPTIIPHVAFLFVYIGVLIFNITPELQGLETDRAHIILLPSLLIVLFSAGKPIINTAMAKFGNNRSSLIIIIVFLLWSVYPISKTYEYVERSTISGDVSSYNSLNKSNIKDISFTRYLKGLDINNKRFFSNGEAAVWLILRVQVQPLPHVNSNHRPNPAYLKQYDAGWPGPGNDGYLIWFNSFSSKEYLATPEELSVIADLEKIYSDEYGSVYSLKYRQQSNNSDWTHKDFLPEPPNGYR